MGRVGCLLPPGAAAEWTFVVGRGFLAALPLGTATGIVASLAALAGVTRVKAEDIVALLPLAGEHAIDCFAAAVQGAPTDSDGIPVSVIVRGAVAVDVYSVGGSRRITADGVRPWLLADFTAVTGLVIGSPVQPAPAPDRLDGGLPCGLGAIAARTLFWSLADLAPDDTLIRERPPDDTVIRERASDDTVIRERASEIRERASDDTVIRERAPDDTVIRDTVPDPGRTGERTRASLLPLPSPSQEGARFAFRLPTGEEIALDAVYHLGRRPRRPRITRDRPPRLLTLASPTAAVSGTHLEIRQEGETVVVTDLGSRNGTIVIPPRGRRRRLRPGESLAVLPGTRMDVGDGNIVEILSASGRS